MADETVFRYYYFFESSPDKKIYEKTFKSGHEFFSLLDLLNINSYSFGFVHWDRDRDVSLIRNYRRKETD